MTSPLNGALAGRWAPTHQHRKGGLYRVLAEGTLETDRSPVVIYDDAEGTIWVRPTAEFDDGRFTALVPPPPPAEAPKGIAAKVRKLLSGNS